MKRDVFVRRGRNNRLYHKFILRDIFEDFSDQEREDHHLPKKSLGKRKRDPVYRDPLSYLMREYPEHAQHIDQSIIGNKKILRKTFRKVGQYSGKHLVDGILKRNEGELTEEEKKA